MITDRFPGPASRTPIAAEFRGVLCPSGAPPVFQQRPGDSKLVWQTCFPSDDLVGDGKNIAKIADHIDVAVDVGLAESVGVGTKLERAQACRSVDLEGARRRRAAKIQLEAVPQTKGDTAREWRAGNFIREFFQSRIDCLNRRQRGMHERTGLRTSM